MRCLLVVTHSSNWPLNVRGVEIVPAKKYLTDAAYSTARDVRVFNVCRSYAYQSLGYYVSLLAEARGHRPQPDIITIQDMKSAGLSRVISEELEQTIQSALRPIKSDRFTLSIYFGRTVAKRDRRLGQRLFNLFPAPLLRAQFVRRGAKWLWQGIRPISAGEIPDNHHAALIESAELHFARRSFPSRKAKQFRYDMAILHDPQESHPPSCDRALERFQRAAARHGINAELIGRDDIGRIGEYDALFIRVTTAVNHYSMRFARRAEALGLAVIDDPTSIVRCTNKVYLAEKLALKRVATPPTIVIHKDNISAAIDQLGLPLVLKQPDSAFSAGVSKAADENEYHEKVTALLEESDLLVAQAFTPTDFDWRVGVLDGKPLYVCRYHMARRHWQIIKHQGDGKSLDGKVDTLTVEEAPKRVVNTAVRAAKLIGDGLYGVDLKQIGNKVYVIEVNDNPSLDAGYEDRKLKGELYDRIMASFVERIERLRRGGAARGR